MGDSEAMNRRVIAGVGCRRGCPAEDIVSVIRRACAETGKQPGALAAPAFKSNEPGLHEAARRLDLPLSFIDPADLSAAQQHCATLSERAEQAVGVASVAEGCALAAAGADAYLLLQRITGGMATCALAEGRVE